MKATNLHPKPLAYHSTIQTGQNGCNPAKGDFMNPNPTPNNPSNEIQTQLETLNASLCDFLKALRDLFEGLAGDKKEEVKE